MRRRARFDASLAELAERLDAADADDRGAGRRGHRGRPAAADLHLLPSRPAAGRPGGADAARSLRPDDRGDRARLPHRPAHAGPAHRARQGEDPRRAHPLSGAVAGRAAGSAGRGAARDLPRVQRGILRLVGRVADAAPISRARRSAWGGCWSSCCRSRRRWGCSALMLLHESRRAARTSPDGRPGPAGRSGPLALEPGADRGRARRWWSGRWSSRRFGPYTLQAAIAAVHAEAPDRRRDGLGRDRRAVRRCWRRRSRRRSSS